MGPERRVRGAQAQRFEPQKIAGGIEPTPIRTPFARTWQPFLQSQQRDFGGAGDGVLMIVGDQRLDERQRL